MPFARVTRIASIAFIVATSGCATTKVAPRPALEGLRTTTAVALAPVDRFDPLVYCGASGAYRCPDVTPKTLDDTPPPAPVATVDPNQLMREQAARMAALQGATAAGQPLEKVIRFDSALFLFDFNKAVLRQKGRDALKAAAPELRGHRLTIAGYTDDIGSDAYNDRLGMRRAEAVRDYLVAEGIPADLISLQGEGRCCFVRPNDTEEGRQQNRRVEIRVEALRAPEGAPGAAVTTLQPTK